MNIEINLPNGWGEITIDQYYKMVDLKRDDYKYEVEYIKEIIKIIIEDDIIFNSLTTDAIITIYKELSFLNEQPIQDDTRTFVIEDKTYTIINNLNEINLGDYINIEVTLENEKNTIINSLDIIISGLMDGDFNNNRNNVRHNVPITIAMSVVKEYFAFRDVLLFNYSGLFGGNKEEEGDTEFETEIGKPIFSNRWKWFSIIERLANGDITKFDEVTKQPLISALNLLSYWKEKDDYQDRLRRRDELRRKHKI